MIEATSNKRVREVVNLRKKASYRREKGLFTVEGQRIFEEVPIEEVREVYVTENFLKNAKAEIREKLERVKCELVSETVFSLMSDTKTPQGVLAVVKKRKYCLEEILATEKQHLLILERLQDPGNLGTIIRAGEGAGLTGVIMSGDTADIYNPKVIRSTMGSIFRVPFVYVEDLGNAIEKMRATGIKVYAAHLQGEHSYDREDYTHSSAFLIGNEANGLTQDVARHATHYIRIPMLGQLESLNAAVAASILMYELARQRRGE